MIKINIKGRRAATKALNEASKEFIEEIEDDVQMLVDNIFTLADTRVRVNFGFLKNSLYKESSGLNGEVGDSAHYSPYVEFGTGAMVDVPEGLEEYAIQFKGNNLTQVNLPARPFLFNSAFEETNKLLEQYRRDGIIKSS